MTDYENPEEIVAREFMCPVCKRIFPTYGSYTAHHRGYSDELFWRCTGLIEKVVLDTDDGKARVGIVKGFDPCGLSLRVRQVSVYMDGRGGVVVDTGSREWPMSGDGPSVTTPREGGRIVREKAVRLAEDMVESEFDRPLEERCVIHGDTGQVPDPELDGFPAPEVIDRAYCRCPACKGLYDSRKSYDRHVRSCMQSSAVNGIVAGGLPVRMGGAENSVYGRVLSCGCDPCTVAVFGNVSFSESGTSRFAIRPELELFMSFNLAPVSREELTQAVADRVGRAVDEGLARLFPSEEVEG